MSAFKVTRLKLIEDLIAEANEIIRSSNQQNSGAGSSSADSGSQGDPETGEYSDEQLDQFDQILDRLLDKVVKPEYFKDVDVKAGKQMIEKYLDYCKQRLTSIAAKIKELIAAQGDSHEEIRDLQKKLFNIAKKASLLEEVYEGLKAREDEEIRQIADEILKKIAEIQGMLSNEYVVMISDAGKKNQALLQRFEKETDSEEKKQIATEILASWKETDEISYDLPEEQKETLAKVKKETLKKVSKTVNYEELEEVDGGKVLSREEADLIARIVKLNYKVFTSEQEIDNEISAIRAKINSLTGSTALRKQSDPETIRYMIDMVDQAELIIRRRFKDKSLQLNKAKGIHFDFDIKLKLYERIAIPVTGKQIADSTGIMKLRNGLVSLLNLLFGPDDRPLSPAGTAWAKFGERVHAIYAKTLNTAAKATGKLLKGREGEMKADALSRLFIPGPAVLDKKTDRKVYEDSVAPGVSSQVPGSIGGLGNPVAPTSSTVGSGDDFNPKKRKKNSKKILEFKDFVRTL